jgi:hypothetical protein
MRPPFSWLCHQESLPWCGDPGSVIPLDVHGPNRLARGETPYPLTRSCLIVFYPFTFSFKKLVRGHLVTMVAMLATSISRK